jgi:rfaE bifunctional protein kinase chain/domain/rfaE bifunctional protein nucleotidyltransferase chain/domain
MLISDKVKDIDDLAQDLTALRGASKTIVQCHGVFDLLHVGHIRHLEQAKRLGDVLVVTVTPDEFVNKGPHRPAFPAELRAEGLAALDCVDYVAINRWPRAVESIRLLRPDAYVKGAEYEDASRDVTGGIDLEVEAARAIGCRIVFTNDITFSSTGLINKHLPVFPAEVRKYLDGFSARHSLAEVRGYLDRARELRVLVVGEAIIDEYQFCQAIGKSSKEPMLALRRLSTERFAGGALAVANNLADFCGHVGVVTVLGEQGPEDDLIRQQVDRRIEKTLVYRHDAPTIVKRRFVESYFFTKLLEIYEMNDAPVDPADDERLCVALREHVSRYDVVVVLDFGHGMLSKRAIEIICERARFLAVNAQSNAGNLGYHTITRYPRADYLSLAENELRLEARDRQGDLEAMLRAVARDLLCPHAAVTRGKHGCLCYGEDEGVVSVPALAGQVVDRMGAGDAFLALTALCVAQRAPMEVVGLIGNAVGAQAVATVGHRNALRYAGLVKYLESVLK